MSNIESNNTEIIDFKDYIYAKFRLANDLFEAISLLNRSFPNSSFDQISGLKVREILLKLFLLLPEEKKRKTTNIANISDFILNIANISSLINFTNIMSQNLIGGNQADNLKTILKNLIKRMEELQSD